MRNSLTIRECILLIALGLLGLAYLGKDVQVIEKKEIKTDTIVEVKKIDLQITSAPVQITQIINSAKLRLCPLSFTTRSRRKRRNLNRSKKVRQACIRVDQQFMVVRILGITLRF